MVKHEIFRLHLRRSCDHATHGSTVYILNIWIWVGQFLFFFNLICRAFRWMFSAFLGYLAIFPCVDLTLQCVFPKNLFHHRPAAKCKDCHDQATVWRTLEQFSHACTNLDTCAQLFHNCIKLLYQHNTCTSFLVLVCKVMCSRLVIEASAAI